MDHRTCKYNTSKTTSFVGYCFLPKYKTKTCQKLILCKGLPCKDYQKRKKEEEEVIEDGYDKV